jgi:hypothetical protein
MCLNNSLSYTNDYFLENCLKFGTIFLNYSICNIRVSFLESKFYDFFRFLSCITPPI